MGQPLLDLAAELHRQRAQLRLGHLRAPPLATAGLDLVWTGGTARVSVSGMALIFGIFPATVREFIGLAASPKLGREAERMELAGVLDTRVQALWAWLPTLDRDCYLEYDHATGEARWWLIGPDSRTIRTVDMSEEEAELDRAFLAALVMTSSRHWGGKEGLERLVERFGCQPLLVAAQVAEALERGQPAKSALALAQTQWPALAAVDETSWAPLAEREHPWVCAQIGRLALRLGLPRAARLLLGKAGACKPAVSAHFDLGQACEVLEDLAGAETAFTRFAESFPDDPDGWRRLLFCRLRIGQLWQADEALRRYRGCGGHDRELVERLLVVLRHAPLPLVERARLVGWLCARIPNAMREHLPLPSMSDHFGERPAGDGESSDDGRRSLADAVAALHADLLAALRVLPAVNADGPGTARWPHALAGPQAMSEALVRLCLLSLPFLRPESRAPAGDPSGLAAERCAEHAALAIAVWGDQVLGLGHGLDDPLLREHLLALARLALASSRRQRSS